MLCSVVQAEHVLNKGKRLPGCPAFIPQDHREAAVQEAVIFFRGIDPREPAAVVVHGFFRVRLLHDQPVEELLLFILPFKEAADGDLRIGEHDQDMPREGGFLQGFSGNIRIDKDRFRT